MTPPLLLIQVDGTPGLPATGTAGIGLVVRGRRGEVVRTRCLRVPASTNVEAEYQAIIAGLDLLLRAFPGVAARCMSDSAVVVAQITGRAAVRAVNLRPLHTHALSLVARCPQLELVAIPRELNRLADALAWEALGGRTQIVGFRAPLT